MGTPALILQGAAYAAGFRGDALTTIVAIGQAEGGTVGLCNPDTTCVSCGPWQIYFGASGTCSQTRVVSGVTYTRVQAAGLLTNAKIAWELSGHGNNFGAWTTYTGGEYLAFMPGGTGYNPSGSPKPTQATATGSFGTPGCPAWCAAVHGISIGPISFPGCGGCKSPLDTVAGSVAGSIFERVTPYLKVAGGGVLMLTGIALLVVGATGQQNKAAGVALAAAGQPAAAAAVASRSAEPAKKRATSVAHAENMAAARERGVQREREDAARREARNYTEEEAASREPRPRTGRVRVTA